MDAESMLRLRRAVNQLSRRLNTTSAAEGLSPSQASALGLIATLGPLSLADLTSIEGLNPTMVSRIVGRLEAMNLVVRERDPADLRSGVVAITAAGRRLHRRIRTQRAARVAEALSHIPADEVSLLERAVPVLEALNEELRPAAD